MRWTSMYFFPLLASACMPLLIMSHGVTIAGIEQPTQQNPRLQLINCQHHQCPGRFLGMMGPNASVSKSNQLHGVIFRFVFINSLRFSPFVGQHSVWIQVVKSWRSDRKSSSFFFLFLYTEWLHEFRIACRRNRSALRPPFTQKNITYAPFPPDSS